MADDDMPEGAKQEIAEAIRIFREDHIHARFDELKALISGKSGSPDPPDPNDPSASPADPSKTPPPVKDSKTDPAPKKKSIWWGDQS